MHFARSEVFRSGVAGEQVFWDVTVVRRVVLVLKYHGAFKFQAWCSKVKALQSFQTSGTTHPTQRCIWFSDATLCRMSGSGCILQKCTFTRYRNGFSQINWWAILFHIWEDQISSLYQDTLCTQTVWVSSAPSSKCWYSTLTRPQLLPSRSLPVHYSAVIIPFSIT